MTRWRAAPDVPSQIQFRVDVACALLIQFMLSNSFQDPKASFQIGCDTPSCCLSAGLHAFCSTRLAARLRGAGVTQNDERSANHRDTRAPCHPQSPASRLARGSIVSSFATSTILSTILLEYAGEIACQDPKLSFLKWRYRCALSSHRRHGFVYLGF